MVRGTAVPLNVCGARCAVNEADTDVVALEVPIAELDEGADIDVVGAEVVGLSLLQPVTVVIAMAVLAMIRGNVAGRMTVEHGRRWSPRGLRGPTSCGQG